MSKQKEKISEMPMKDMPMMPKGGGMMPNMPPAKDMPIMPKRGK